MNPPTQKITNQMWAFIFVITGCGMIFLSKKFNIVSDIGAGIAGAGLQSFTSVMKTESSTNTGSGTVVQGDINLPSKIKQEGE